MAPPTTFGVVAEREVYLVKEAVPGTVPATAPGVPVPLTSFKPSNKPMWLADESFEGSMGDNYGIYQGPLIAGFDIGGHVFGDHGLAEALYNLLGDYTTTGTTASPAAVTSSAVAAGASALPVASGGASFTAGMFVWIQDAGTPAANEVVKVGSGSTATSVVLDPSTPTRFAHLTATPFTNTTAPYTHVFALLNGSVGAANGPAQGPTHCFTDRQGIAANGAEQYAYACFSEVTLTGNAEKLLDWSGKAVCASRVTAAAPVGMTNVSSVVPVPSWRTVTGWGGPATGGTKISTIAEHSVTLTRAVKALNTEQGSQQPFIIARGKQSNSGKVTIMPAIDDSALTALLANTQPQLQFITDNGLTGANQVRVTVDILLAALETADIKDGAELFGFDVSFKVPHTAASSGGITMTGASGGKGAVKVSIINAIPTY
jgi:hypothetical protein